MNFWKIFLLLILILPSGCRWFTDAALPYMAWTKLPIPPGTPAFQLGYKHGCEQIVYSRGNMFYRSRYNYHYDPKMNGSPEYRFGYARGKSFCFNYVISPASGPHAAPDRFLFPYKEANGFISGGIVADSWENTTGPANANMFSGVGAPIQVNPGNGLDALFTMWTSAERGGKSALGADPFWAGGSSGQFFGQ